MQLDWWAWAHSQHLSLQWHGQIVTGLWAGASAGWGALSTLEDVSESSGFELCGQSLCSSSFSVLLLLDFAVKNLSVMKSLWVQWEGKKRNLTRKIWFFNKYMGDSFVNVTMEINYFHKIHSVLTPAVHHDFRSCKGDLLQQWGFTYQNHFHLK